MTTAQSTENAAVFGTTQPGGFLRIGGVPSAAGRASQAGIGENPSDRYLELFRMNGIELTSGEAGELSLLGEFLSRHVHAGGNGDVQCMLLWNEWVRTFKRRTADFPDLIREKEFRSVILGMFGTGIATDGWRGAVYPGVRYVP